MSNKFSQFGCFSLPSDITKPYQNLTECFDLDSNNYASIILCAHDGTEVSKLILHNLKTYLKSLAFVKLTDNSEIKYYLENIFLSFDKKYLKDADQYLRKRNLLNERLSKMELDTEIGDLFKSLEELERISKCGCTLSLAILLNNMLYVANIGDNQVIVAMDDEIAEEHKFLLLTEEHNFYNECEIQRIKNDCELNANGLRNLYGKSYGKYHSRCLGHYEMKCEYMQLETFKHSKASPITCLPQITDGIKMNSKWCNLLLVSSGLYYLVMELIYDRDKIAGEIANEFMMTKKRNPNKGLSEISELVILKYLDIYKAAFEENSYSNCSDYYTINYEELTIMAIKLSISENIQCPQYEDDSVDNEEIESEIYSDNQNSNFPFPYVIFDSWYDAESKLSIKESEQFDSIFSLSENLDNFILEEDSICSPKLSRATTIEDNHSSLDVSLGALSNEILSNQTNESL